MIALVVQMKAREDKAAEFEGVMKALAEKVRANESGCALYQLARSKKSALEYVLLERYQDEAALAQHSGSDHFKQAMPAMMACLDGPPQVSVYDEID